MNILEKNSCVALLVALVAPAVGCGSDASDDGADPAVTTTENLNCTSNEYVAFDSANHANQDIRLATYAEMNDLMKDGDFDAAKALYLDADGSANLQEKVQGRVDEHMAAAPLQGDRMDATVMAWLDVGAASDDELVQGVAKQWVDKTLGEFVYLSVHHETLAGARKNWDEALGYYGSSTDNAEGDLRGLAATAAKRDGNNGTTLETDIFNNLILGACELDGALGAEAESIEDLGSVPELQAVVEDVDTAMLEVLAYSAGHEAIGMQEKLAAAELDTDGLIIKAAELAAFFLPLERVMQERGGDSAARAQEIRDAIDSMVEFDPATPDFGDVTWMDDLGDAPQMIIDNLQVEFDIDIRA